VKTLFWGLVLSSVLTAGVGCGTLPEPKMTKYEWPKDHAYVEEPKRPFSKLGMVKTKVDYPTLDPNHDEDQLCRNYFIKAVSDLVKRAHDAGGDAVMDVRAVTFFEDGSTKTFKTAECFDDGESGQVLAEGIAIKWKPEPDKDKN
jgi:hypothetical protein